MRLKPLPPENLMLILRTKGSMVLVTLDQPLSWARAPPGDLNLPDR